jgi:spore protease
MGRSVRSDLAAEVHAFLREGGAGEIPGVRWREEQRGAVTVTRVEILDRRGEAAMGKAPGTYVTLESSQLRRRDRQVQEAVARLLAEELAGLLRLESDALVLVVGLGNWNATPDALGPRVVGSILVTRHLGEFAPREVAGRLPWTRRRRRFQDLDPFNQMLAVFESELHLQLLAEQGRLRRDLANSSIRYALL